MCYEKGILLVFMLHHFRMLNSRGVEAIEAYGHTPGHTVYQIGNAFSCTLLFVTKYLYG